MSTAEPALKFDMEVKEEGRVELRLPFPRGTHIVVFVVPESPDTFQDLTMAAQTSLDFWDNALDDEWESCWPGPQAQAALLNLAREAREDYDASRVTDIAITEDGRLSPA